MAKSNKICRVCGKDYQYCSNCNYKEPAYKQLVCSDVCNEIWKALSKNGVGLATAQETLDVLSEVKMPAVLQPSIKAHVDRLKAEVQPVVKQQVVDEEQVKPVNVLKKQQQKKVFDDEQPSQE